MIKTFITSILFILIGQQSFGSSAVVMQAIMSDENLDFRCVRAALRQGEFGLSLLEDFRSRIDCNESQDSKSLCDCTKKLNQMDNDNFKDSQEYKSFEEKIKKEIAAEYAKDILHSENLASLRHIYLFDSIYGEESKCDLKFKEKSEFIYLNKFTEEVKDKNDLNKRIMSKNSSKEKAHAIKNDYEFISKLATTIQDQVPNADQITSVKSMNDIVKNIIGSEKNFDKFMNSMGSPIYFNYLNDTSADVSVASRVIIKTLAIMKRKSRSFEHYNSIREMGHFSMKDPSSYVSSRDIFNQIEEDLSASSRLAESSIKDVIEEEFSKFADKGCDGYQAIIDEINPDTLNQIVEQDYASFFNDNLHKSLSDYQKHSLSIAAGMFNKFSQTYRDEREYKEVDLLGEEAVYRINTFYCDKKAEMEKVTTSFNQTLPEDAEEAIKQNVEISQKLNTVNKELVTSKNKVLSLDEEVENTNEEIEKLESQKKLYELILKQGEGKAFNTVNGQRLLNLNNSKIRDLYYEHSGLPQKDIESMRKLYNKEKTNLFIIPNDVGLTDKISVANDNISKRKGIVNDKKIRITEWKKNIKKLKERRAELKVSFKKNDKIIAKYADKNKKAMLYSHYGARVDTYSTDSEGKVRSTRSENKYIKEPAIIKNGNLVELRDVAPKPLDYSHEEQKSTVMDNFNEVMGVAKEEPKPVFGNNVFAPQGITKSAVQNKPRSVKVAAPTQLETPYDSSIERLEEKISEQKEKVSSIENSSESINSNSEKAELSSAYQSTLDELKQLKEELQIEKEKALAFKAKKNQKKVNRVTAPAYRPIGSAGVSQSTRASSGSSSGSGSSDSFSGGASFSSAQSGPSANAVSNTGTRSSTQSSLTLDSSRSTNSGSSSNTASGNFSLREVTSSALESDNRIVRLDVDFSTMSEAKKEELFKGLFEEGEEEVIIELANGEKILISNNEALVKKEDKREIATENPSVEKRSNREVKKYQDLLDTLKVTEEPTN